MRPRPITELVKEQATSAEKFIATDAVKITATSAEKITIQNVRPFAEGREVWFWEIVKGVPTRRYGRIAHLNRSNRRVLVQTSSSSGPTSVHRDDLHLLSDEPVVDTTLKA